MATVSRKSSATGPVLRSTASPSLTGRFYTSHSSSSSSTGFASSTSSFSSRSAGGFFTRTASPPRVSLARTTSPSAQSVRFSLHDRPTSPSRSISVSPHGSGSHHRSAMKKQINTTKRTCMCSPTSHPGSFRCSLHKNCGLSTSNATPYSQNRLNARRSAMTNSLVRIGGVEGEIVKRALAALIRPSSHSQRRRADFRPRPSRLSAMSKCSE